jgi:methionyl-tRNA formyltransferase
VRAMQPWPTAYTYLHRAGKEPMRVMIARATARPASDREAASESGEFIVSQDPTAIVVRCGGVSVARIDELQPAGKKRMTAEEFLRGYPLKDGDRFGPEVVS